MVSYFRAGGFNMWIIAALAIVLIWNAARFARSADAQRLAVIRALTWALVFCSITGFFSSLGVTAVNAVRMRDKYPLEESLLLGFAESTANLTFGAGLATIAWGLVAVGLRRMPGERS